MKLFLIFAIILFSMFSQANSIYAASQDEVLYSSSVFQFVRDWNVFTDILLVLPVLVALYAIRVARLMRGGKFERIWKFIAAAMSILVLVKVADGLEALGVLQVTGLSEVLELLMIVVLFLAFFIGYRSLQSALHGPLIEKPIIAVPITGEQSGGNQQVTENPPATQPSTESTEKKNDELVESTNEVKEEKKKKK